jgi:hypothetical protein
LRRRWRIRRRFGARRAGGACQRAGGEEPHRIQHVRQRPSFWIDQPPPERDPELGIGKNVAWQTPIHREAVRRALREV